MATIRSSPSSIAISSGWASAPRKRAKAWTWAGASCSRAIRRAWNRRARLFVVGYWHDPDRRENLVHQRHVDALAPEAKALGGLAKAILGKVRQPDHLAHRTPVGEPDEAVDPVVPLLCHAEGAGDERGEERLAPFRFFP